LREIQFEFRFFGNFLQLLSVKLAGEEFLDKEGFAHEVQQVCAHREEEVHDVKVINYNKVLFLK